MASRIKGITVEIGGDTTKLQDSLRKVNTAINETQSKLKDVNKLLKLDPKNTELLSQKQAALKESISATGEKLEALKKAQEQAKQQLENGTLGQDKYNALQREIAETEQNLKSLEKEYRNFGSVAAQQIAAVGEKMGQLGEKVTAAGQKLTRTVTAPIVAVGAVGVTKFAEVDKTMTLANQTMGNTAEEAALLEQAMAKAAANSTFGMNDAAGAVLNFARAGLDAEQAAAALAPAMNLAAGEGGNLDTVSAGLVATINGFGDSFESASDYADIFAAACNNSALDINSLSDAMSVAAPIFHAAGYSVQDAALYMGTMANSGIDANTAANALKTGMARLAKPAKEAQDALDKLDIEIFNADGTMKDSITVQKLLHDSFAGLSEQEQLAAASAIFGKNNMSSWLALINTAPSEVGALSTSLAEAAGTTEQMSTAMMSGFGGSIEKLKSSLDVFLTTLGRLAAQYLQPVIDKVQALVDKFLSLDEGTQNTIVRIAGIAAAVGPVLVIGGKLMTGIGQFLTYAPKIVSAIKLIGGMFSPWTIVIAAVIALAVLLYKNWDKVKEYAQKMAAGVKEAWKKLSDSVSRFSESVKQKVSGLSDHFKSFGESAKKAWSGIWEQLSPILQPYIDGVKALVDSFLSYFHGIFETFAGVFTGDWDRALSGTKETFTGFTDTIKNAFSLCLTSLKTSADLFLGLFGTSWDEVWSTVKSVFLGVWNSITGFFENVWSKLKTAASNGLNSISSSMSSVLTGISSTFSAIWEGIKTVVTAAVNTVKTTVSNVWNGIKSTLSGILSSISSNMQNIWSGISTSISERVSAIRSSVSNSFDSIRTTAQSVWNSIKTAITTPIEAAKNAVRNAIEQMKSFFHFQWSLPHIALPHFSIQGSFSLNPPSIPYFSVSWYKKAMDAGMILNSPTIFGIKGNQLLGAGEAGSETIVGTESLMEMIRKAVAGVERAMTINYGGVTINVYGAEGQDITALADEIEERINLGVLRKNATFA